MHLSLLVPVSILRQSWDQGVDLLIPLPHPQKLSMQKGIYFFAVEWRRFWRFFSRGVAHGWDKKGDPWLAWRIGFWPRWERGWGRSWLRSINKSRGETQSSRRPALGSGPAQCQCGARTEWQCGMPPGSSSQGGQSPQESGSGLLLRTGEAPAVSPSNWGRFAEGGDNTLKLCRWKLRATRIWILMLIQLHLYAQGSLNNIWLNNFEWLP